MTLPFILLCVLAALLELDTTYAFQTLLSRPIITGPIFGWLTGDVAAGIQIGIFAELLFADISPLGGIIPPSGVVASVIPLILYAQGIDLYFGFVVGVLGAVLYSFFDALLRKTRFKWLVFLEKRIGRKPSDITRIITATLLLSFLMTFIFISVLAWAGAQLMFMLYPYFTPRMHFAFRLAYIAVPWIGLAALIPVFRLKTR